MTPIPTLDDLRAEEARLVLDRFDYAAAHRLGLRLYERAAERTLPIAIEVTHGATPVFFALMPGATPDNVDWVRRKRAVALRFHRSSLFLRLECESKGVEFHARYGLAAADYVASGGSVPLVVRGVGVVGTSTVSGLPDVEDHRLVTSALLDLGMTPKSP